MSETVLLVAFWMEGNVQRAISTCSLWFGYHGENIVEAVLETRPSAHACFVALVIDVDVSSTSGHFIAFALSANMRKHVAECAELLHHSIRLGMCHGKIVYLQPSDRR